MTQLCSSYSVVAYVAACGKILSLTLDAQLIAIALFERAFVKIKDAVKDQPIQLVILACVDLAAKSLQRYPRSERTLRLVLPFALSVTDLHKIEHVILFALDFQVFPVSDRATFRFHVAKFFAEISDLLAAEARAAVSLALEATALLVLVFPGLSAALSPRDRRLSAEKLAAFAALHAAVSFTRKEKLKDCALVRKLLAAADLDRKQFIDEVYPLCRDFINFLVV